MRIRLFTIFVLTALAVQVLFQSILAQEAKPVTIGRLPNVEFRMVLPPGYCLADASKSNYEAEYIARIRTLMSPQNTLIAFLLPCSTVRDGRDDAVSDVAPPAHWITFLATNEAPEKPSYRPDGKLVDALNGYAKGVQDALHSGPYTAQLFRDKAKELPHIHDFVIEDEDHAFGARDAHGVYFAGAVTKLADGKRMRTMSMTAMTFLFGYSITVNAYAPTGDREARSALFGQAMIPMRNLRNYTQAVQ